jgi:hypothetical protein
MNAFLQAVQARIRRAFRRLVADEPRATQSTPVRSGWPPLSSTPLLRRRGTDARPWYPLGPRDDWKR